VALLWAVPFVIVVKEFVAGTYLFAREQPLFAQVWAGAAPLIAFAVLGLCGYLYGRRILSGWLVTTISVLAFVGFAQHFVWLTGGV